MPSAISFLFDFHWLSRDPALGAYCFLSFFVLFCVRQFYRQTKLFCHANPTPPLNSIRRLTQQPSRDDIRMTKILFAKCLIKMKMVFACDFDFVRMYFDSVLLVLLCSYVCSISLGFLLQLLGCYWSWDMIAYVYPFIL